MKLTAVRPSNPAEVFVLFARSWTVGAVALAGLNACGTSDTGAAQPDPPVDEPPSEQRQRSKLSGEELFRLPFPGAENERSCATCHVPEDNFTLTPAHVARLLEENPDDPLFSRIDADDPSAETLTFEHLKKGLVRVVLTLPNNVDVIDEEGNVTTPSDRKIFVWRGVPSLADSALTAPYQLDGSAKTLEVQAQGAVIGHSQGGELPKSELERIADFERGVFSSARARSVAEELASGVAFDEVSDVEDTLKLSPEEQRGKEVYDQLCANCHGGANQATIVDRDIHDMAFPVIKDDGTLLYEVPATAPPTVVLTAQPKNEFLNIGSAFQTYLSMIGATEHESFTWDVSFPQYRYRFYTDDSRTVIAADLPPAAPPFDVDGGERGDVGDPVGPGDGGGPGDDGGPGDGGGFVIELDGDGNPVVGPNFAPQFFSTDPGRSMVTGNPNDFEAFDVPTLRGVAKTAPYFHNNGANTLEAVVDLYSDHLLSRFPTLILPGEKEADLDGDAGPEEAMTAEQKRDLVAFLKVL
jgi:hypothetical protein